MIITLEHKESLCLV